MIKRWTPVLGLVGLILGVLSFAVGLSGIWAHSTWFYALAAVLVALGGTAVGDAHAYIHRPSTATKPTQIPTQKT